jgi:AcrR family transcriptional regulator
MDTHAVIMSEFRELLTTVPYNKITIATICQACSISKKTFYKYFDNKLEIVQAIYHKDFIAPFLELREILPMDGIRSASIHMTELDLQTLKKNRTIYENLLKNYGRMELIDLMIQNTEQFNREVYREQYYTFDNLGFAAYFAAASGTMIKIRWMESGFKETPEELGKLIINYVLARITTQHHFVE